MGWAFTVLYLIILELFLRSALQLVILQCYHFAYYYSCKCTFYLFSTLDNSHVLYEVLEKQKN